jgi:hypothetical protein
MGKQLWVAPALLALALQPARAQTTPTVRNLDFKILHAQPATLSRPNSPGFAPAPAGFLNTDFCIQGGADRIASLAARRSCRFVGAVLCLDPGPGGNFLNFAGGGPAGTDPAIQAIRLIKRVPRVDRCPDRYPGAEFTQTGIAEIRTFFPLKYSPPGTVITLEVEFNSMTRTTTPRPVGSGVNRFNFELVTRPETLSWVVESLHCSPLGVCEVPCLADETVFQTLVTQANTVAANAGNPAMAEEALTMFEAELTRNLLMQLRVWSVDDQGRLNPCAIFGGELPSNNTVAHFQLAVVDTVENPCACKLLADVAFLKRELAAAPE